MDIYKHDDKMCLTFAECMSGTERVLNDLNSVTSVIVDGSLLSSSNIVDLFADDESAKLIIVPIPTDNILLLQYHLVHLLS